MSSIRLLGVVGAGQMGSGIAQVAASVAKLPVLLCDANEPFLHRQIGAIDANLKRIVAKGKLHDGDRQQAMARIRPVTTIAELRDCDFVIEAVTESFETKAKVLASLSPASPGNTIVASNTSSIPIARLAAVYDKHVPNGASNFIGMHFMNPVPQMRLVELIAGRGTSEATFATTKGLAEMMGKTTTRSADVPGFIANRILMPYINEAIFALHESVGTREDIDETMVLGTGVPMGPLALADLVGLDICLAIMQVMHAELGDPKYRPCPLLLQHVDAGRLGNRPCDGHYLMRVGRKSGSGFYEYPARREQ